jgi:hypothetical protein
VAPLAAVPAFHDAFGYFPGIEALAVPVPANRAGQAVFARAYALADPDASVVIPSLGYYSPRTPTGFSGVATAVAPETGTSTDETLYLSGEELRWLSAGRAGGTDVHGPRSGHPGSSGVQVGIHAQVVSQADHGNVGVVRFWRSRHELEVTGAALPGGADRQGRWRVEATVRNSGERTPVGVYSAFGRGYALVDGTPIGGGVPVAVGPEVALAAARSSDEQALAELAVPAELATAIVWPPADLDTAATAAVAYELERTEWGSGLTIRHEAFTAAITRTWSLRLGALLYLPDSRR